MLLFGLKTATCDCSFEKKAGFQNIRYHSKIKKVGILPDQLNESSGISYQKADNSFLSHNDSGNSSELFTIDQKGKLLATRQFPLLKNNDWEDICTDDKGNIYIGDFGNNRHNRTNLTIFKVSGSKIDTIEFRYADQNTFPSNVKNFDCEAFFWYNENLYLFSKNWEKKRKTSKLYQISDQAGNYVISPIDEVELKTSVTSADINPSGTEFALLTYGKALFFEIKDGKVDFSNPKYCRKTRRKQTEAICYKNDKELYFTNEQGTFYQLKIKHD
jgi:hypothetical protein